MQSVISCCQTSNAWKLISATPERDGCCSNFASHNRWSAPHCATVGACLTSCAWISWRGVTITSSSQSLFIVVLLFSMKLHGRITDLEREAAERKEEKK